MRRRTTVILASIALGGGAIAFFAIRAASTVAPPVDPYALHLDPVRPTGEPIHVARVVAAGDRFRTTGTFSYRQRATGKFGREEKIPSRRIDGTVVATRRVAKDPRGTFASVVEAKLDSTLAEGSTAPVTRKDSFTIRFAESPRGGATSAPVQLEGIPPELADYLETLQNAWTERPPLPEQDVRVGEAFPPESVMDTQPLKGRLWISFRWRDPGLGYPQAPLEGRVWVTAKEGDVVVVRTALRHAYSGDTGPRGPKGLHIAYVARVDGTRRIGIADGVSRAYDVSIRTRLSVKSSDLDYMVETDEHTAVTTTKLP